MTTPVSFNTSSGTSNSPFIGIDFGTTNSIIAFAKEKRNGELASAALDIPRIKSAVPSLDGSLSYVSGRSKTLPSCVYYSRDGVMVGDFAKEQYSKYPESVSRSVKSQMGNPHLEGLADIPDSTPEEVCAQVLRPLKKEAENILRRGITDAIIAVPASYGAEQKEATMRAMEMAGFRVRDKNGNWLPLLISEPNAVLYDIMNRIKNGELPSDLDLSEKKLVLVFDIGGGTLDVTLHEVQWAEDNSNRMDITEVATSRYTRLAGDDFDRIIADALLARWQETGHRNTPASADRLLMPRLLTAAEELKIHLSSKVNNQNYTVDSWFDDDAADSTEEITESVSVMLDSGIFNYTVSKKEFEEMIAPLMGNHLRMSDCRRYASLSREERRTILAPVLDILAKAERHYKDLGRPGFTVDAVILNGGMSNLYAIRERLASFFGLEPITTVDPDLSVANGAALYSYYLANNDGVVETIQNEDLYLGLGRGGTESLIRYGQKLPYSVTIDGFRVKPHTGCLEIPIKRGSLSGDFPTFARGVVTFDRTFRTETDLRLDCSFDRSGLISIRASLLNQATGMVLSTGSVEMQLGSGMDERRFADKILPKTGSRLIPANEISSLRTLCAARKRDMHRINGQVDTILKCANLAEFEGEILRALNGRTPDPFRLCLYRLLPEMVTCWTPAGQTEMRRICRTDILSDYAGGFVNPLRMQLSGTAREILELLTPAEEV
ncbi:MAG: Hsp70 family protein [Clostridia bacterium]|nr:Hsp70 family protein [Clostridia bacterium]